MDRFDGRTVVVTGAGRGIGRSHALFLAGEGANVVVNDLGTDVTGSGSSADTAESVVDAIRAAGGAAVADHHDVASEAPGVIATAIQTYGRVDGLVNNAGIVAFSDMGSVTDDQVSKMVGVHVLGPLNTARAAWPHMVRQGYGRIVNTSSVAVFGVGSSPLYQLGKASIIGLTRAQAADGAGVGIKVNTVMPMGYSRMADTQADLAEFMKKRFPPELVSPFVATLLLEEVPWTGEAFAVAGGRAARVFLGTTPGLVGVATIDDVLGGVDAVMDMTGFVAPMSMDEEIGFEYARLGIDLAELGINLQELGTAEEQ